MFVFPLPLLNQALQTCTLPADAVEVGTIGQPWGIKGWFKVYPYSASAEALFVAKDWYLQAKSGHGAHSANTLGRNANSTTSPRPSPSRDATFGGTSLQAKQCVLLSIAAVKAHTTILVANGHGMCSRSDAQVLHGLSIFVSRAAFPDLPEDEYYWVDLLGLQVVNREGVALGLVRDLLPAGPQTTLIIERQEGKQRLQCLIPFVAAYVDHVDLAQKTITVDWQLDY